MSPGLGDIAMRNVIDEMRIGRHPAQQWEIDKQYWVIRTIEQYMMPSQSLRDEAWAEHGALRLDAPVRPYERHELKAAGQV